MTTPINPLTQQPLSESELSKIVALGNELCALEADMATLEAELEKAKERLNQIQLKELPDAMSQIGLSEFTLTNGIQLAVAPIYQCSVSDADPELKAKALKWLRTHDAGDLIKHEFKCALGVEAEALVASLRGFLNKKQIPFKDGQSVNAATLKSFMKECIEAGKEFPLDIFRGYFGKKASITNNKGKKK